MWRKAGCDIAAFDGRPAAEFAIALANAIHAMESDLPNYRAMNPRNGWGDADSCLNDFLRPLWRIAATAHPAAVVSVSR
jgi:hypothetical protein